MIAISLIQSAKLKVGEYVSQRISQFKSLKEKGITEFSFYPFLDIKPYKADIFSEASFCILTANSSASLGIKIQAEVGIEGFREYTKEKLYDIFRKNGHRFALQRAERIVKLRDNLELIESLPAFSDSKKARDILVEKVDGYGYKEASHLLRNIGFDDIAIVDRHIYRFLLENNLVQFRKTITKKAYLECEEALLNLCEKMGISMSELDLYIFYIKTSKVLK